ncbi:hypothetical protein KCP78_03525 [Salmonella enterica subsp. enterica]|nr:hypothetical protein KCP78_03525 [Salmonella enterica subsp. enterica]
MTIRGANLRECRSSADMRDEEMALRDDEVTGELPPIWNMKSLTRSAKAVSMASSLKNSWLSTKPDKRH